MKPHHAILSSATAGLLLLLAACGDGGDPRTPPTDGPLESPAPAPAPAPAGAQITPVGQAQGAAVSASIGAAGGSLSSPDGALTVTVPPQAFADPVVLSLQPVDNYAPGGLGAAWRITPHDVVAQRPVTLTWRIADADADAQAVAGLSIARQRADGGWTALRTAQHDAAARTVSVQTQRFSDWSLVAGLRLSPAQAMVEVGGRVGLSIQRCRHLEPIEDDTVLPLAACETLGHAGFDGFAWASNGVAGGDAVQGRVQKPTEFLFPGVAEYLAPAAVPPGNPVAVSARYTEPPFDAGVTLVAQVRVLEPDSGCDWVRQVQAFGAELSADHQWSGNDGAWSVDIAHSATLKGRLQRVPGQAHILHFRGALPGTQVRVQERRSLGTGSAAYVETESGAGVPFLGDAPEAPASVATLTVDTLRCVAWFGAEFHVDSQRTSAGLPSATPTQGGGSFAIGERPLAALHTIAGKAVVPAVGTGSFPDHYGSRGLNNALQREQAGTAEVQWLFQPQP